MDLYGHPILSCEQAGRFEKSLFDGDEDREWPAMQMAGAAVARAVVEDFKEIGGLSPQARVLVMAGKGHNGGDALLAAAGLASHFPSVRVEVILPYGQRGFRPLAARAWRQLVHAATDRVVGIRMTTLAPSYDLVIDGLFGFQFRPPLDARTRALLNRINTLPVRLRAAVDLPSGLDEDDAFRADFSYATGILKAPLLDLPNAGRLRYLDLGFATESAFPQASDWVLGTGLLDPLRILRAPQSDKRTYGHLLVLGGSRNYPGAVLMSVLSALRSGVGLVTAFVPESLAPAFAARAPEAMWVGWPETPDGGLAMEGAQLLRERMQRATSLLMGPGLGREPETLALVREIVRTSSVPIVLDADALKSEIVTAAQGPLVLTPHAGEFARIAGGRELQEFAKQTSATVVLKGPVTRISDGHRVYHSLSGGPILARGGSGDLLAGLIGGLLAQNPAEPLLAAARGAIWHGRAADLFAQAHGQVAVQITGMLDFLGEALRRR